MLPADDPLIPAIRPRSAWAREIPDATGLQREDDVRFLLVHHTQTPNDEGATDEVAARLRQIHDFHTRTKGWKDVAYNFFVDRSGRIWEGRTGSLTRPVRGDATGGSQGHAILCCFVGDHTAVPPTEAAQAAMVRLLAWLAETYSVDLSSDRPVSFVSRGSNRWPKGARVRTRPVAGHRDMSRTECPGDAAYGLISGTFLPQAAELVRASRSSAPPSTTARGSSPTDPSTSPSQTPSTSPRPTGDTKAPARPPDDPDLVDRLTLPVAGAGLVAAGVAWVIARRLRAGRGQD